MKRTVYRNLDRPFSFFGIKGIFLAFAAVGSVVILIASIIVGALSNVFAGLGVATVMLVTGYLSLIETQQKISGRNIPGYIRINSKVWKR